MVNVTINKWFPDTCSCIIEHVFDADSNPATMQDVFFLDHTVSCKTHAGLQGVAKYNLVLQHNQLKNVVQNEAGSTMPTLTNIPMTFSFTGVGAAAVLNITYGGLSKSQKSTLQATLDAKVGAGKVVVL